MDRVERNQREMRIITVVALCVAVICLSVAYASMNQSLKVAGNAQMRKADWNIHFANMNASTTGVATYTMPSVSDTTLSNFGVVLNKPGDSVTFTFDIVNDGSINAVLGTLTKGKPICDSLTSDKDAKIVCDNITYTLKYRDDTLVEEGDQLLTDTYKSVKLVVAYNDKATEVPNSTVNITGLDVALIYNQE